jgi:uncharacterized membrane protein HdeD (DUF308 family)
MPAVSIAFGVILTALGVCFYFPDKIAATAFIPSYFGVVLIVLGLLAYKDGLRKHVMHFAAMVGLIGCLVPAVRIVPALPAFFGGESLPNANAIRAQALMAVISLAFVLLCVNSFIEARRARKASGAAES